MKACIFVLSLLLASNALALQNLACETHDKSFLFNVKLIDRNDSATLNDELFVVRAPDASIFTIQYHMQPRLSRTIVLKRQPSTGGEYRNFSAYGPMTGRELLLQLHAPFGEPPKSGFLHMSNRKFAGAKSVLVLVCNRK